MTILVTGGAGYIGSHVVKLLGENKEDIVIIDNLSTGFSKALTFGKLYQFDLHLEEKLKDVFENHKIEAVIHFAGSIIVPESVEKPLDYYDNNSMISLKLISLCQKYQVKKFIFSSTAAVYGVPDLGICSETTQLNPISPYGRSKLMTEWMLKDFSQASDFKYVALRYFNVAGADPEGKIGQSFPAATHLIKAACETSIGKRLEMKIFGTDYKTKDGTGIRDYIHVMDLASAHLDALSYLRANGTSEVLNCGYSTGFSVREVLEVVKKVSGNSFKVIEELRRAGDPGTLIADATKIKSVLKWKPKYQDLEFIVKTALNWEKNKLY